MFNKKTMIALPFALLIAGLTACGGNSDSGSKASDTPCAYGNLIDLTCYLTPGKSGDKPTITGTLYAWEEEIFKPKSEQIQKVEIEDNRLTINSSLADSFDPLDAMRTTNSIYEWDENNIKVTVALNRRGWTSSVDGVCQHVAGKAFLQQPCVSHACYKYFLEASFLLASTSAHR